MLNDLDNRKDVVETYQQRAPSYNLALKLFDAFAWFGFNISGWRKQAISALNLKPGDTVIDIGCGTGLNFPHLHQTVGQDGKIIGVDLSCEMLAEARRSAADNHWDNVELVCADASLYEFPENVDGVLSTYAMTLVPNCGQVVSRACKSLSPNGRLVVLDMAWPRYCPLWWRHVLFFLRSYGVTAEVLKRRPWELVQKAMKENLIDITRKSYWFGFFYLCYGAAKS
jgi:demethylmenaquinone methyltransferase/2-methoxy-6-polyprenyl-1,4-benzoquinol methylase